MSTEQLYNWSVASQLAPSKFAMSDDNDCNVENGKPDLGRAQLLMHDNGEMMVVNTEYRILWFTFDSMDHT